jgi:hypothetical protein
MGILIYTTNPWAVLAFGFAWGAACSAVCFLALELRR